MLLHGVDIVKIERIEKLVERYGRKFLSRFFTNNEIEFCFKRKDYLSSLAVRFAAKEAAYKAYPSGEVRSVAEFSVKIDSSGKPILLFRGEPVPGSSLALSHTRDVAVASVIILK
ncbi:holo-ACP synthase [bacterium]|nr:holo-ACP synthase [bacterium]